MSLGPRLRLLTLVLALSAATPALAAPPPAAVAAHKEGLRLAKNNLIPEALSSLEKAVALDPTYADAWSDLGNTHLASGGVKEAARAFERAVALRPELQIARYNLAYALRKSGEHARAAEQYRLYLQRDPKDADAHYGLAESLKAGGEPLAAAEAYETYARVEARPGQAKWVAKAKETAKELRESAPAPREKPAFAAEGAPKLAAPQAARAKETTGEARGREPSPSPSLGEREAPVKSGGALELGFGEDAPLVDQAAPIPGVLEVAPSGHRPAAFRAGLADLERGEWARAMPSLAAASKEAPGDAMILAAVAAAHLGAERAPEAEAAYRAALAVAAPAAVPALHLGLAEALRLQGETDGARAQYTRAREHPSASLTLQKLATERLGALED